jgi:hypothetical protein
VTGRGGGPAVWQGGRERPFPTLTHSKQATQLFLRTALPTSTKGFANTNFLENVMDGYGTQYTVLRVASGENFTELLWAPDGTARYAGYVM